LVLEGDFSNSGAAWTTYGNITVAVNGGAFVSTGDADGGYGACTQAETLIAGRTYELNFDVTAVTGGGSVYNYCDSLTKDLGTASVTGFTDTFVSDGTGGIDVRTTCSNGQAVTIDNISLKEVGVASGWTDADQQLHIPQTALQSYNESLWCTASGGTNAIVEVADNSNLDVDALDFSISCWIYPITESDYLPIFRKGGAGVEGYSLVVNTSNYIALNLNDGASDNGYTNLTDAVVPSGKWSHVVVTCDRSSSTGVKCYLNGVLQTATANPTGENEDIGNSSGVVLLGWSTSDADSFSGTGTEFMLFKDSILSSSEVLELYNDGKALDGTTHSLFSTKCTAYYRNNGLSSWPNLATVADSGATSTAAAAGAVSAGGTETILIPQGVDSTRDAQGFIMNKQKDTSSLNFTNGSDSPHVDLGSITTIADDEAFSFVVWLKPDDLAANNFIGRGSSLDWARIHDSNTIKFRADNTTVVFSTSTLVAKEWVHVAIVRKASNDLVSVYINGAAGVDTETLNEPFDYRYLGSGDTANDNFRGAIDGFLIYEDELSAAEVLRNYNATKGNHRN